MSELKQRKKQRFMGIGLLIIIGLAAGGFAFLNQRKFGRLPDGERLERIHASPNYREGSFKNRRETPQITSEKGFPGTMADFLFKKTENLRPATDLPAIKTDLHTLDRKEDVLVWFGHGSYFIQTDGKRILVDPVFEAASPVSFYNKPFKGTDIYKAEDMPDIDYLVISHDHWDHLDYPTVRQLKDRTGKVICALGVGAHFEYWGFGKEQIIEMDWEESAQPGNGFTVYCLPSRHFSGRGLKPNQTLWASFLMQTPTQKIYIGGDSGYDTHYKEIYERFGRVDLAILENGQYDADWKYIHLRPDDLVQAIKDLQPQKVLTVHNSKYALGKHAWDEPLRKISEAAQKDSLPLITPEIGEIVHLKDSTQTFTHWWEK